ncbi:MAG: hypothetical protein ABIW83_06590 [Allosphingosinicella sp.]
MSKIKVLGGSVDKKLEWGYDKGWIRGTGSSSSGWSKEVRQRYEVRLAKEFAVADQSTGVKVFGAVGWGSVGAVIAGPVGAIVGGMLGGRGETVTFLARFRDDTTMLGQVPKKDWLKMLADRA